MPTVAALPNVYRVIFFFILLDKLSNIKYI